MCLSNKRDYLQSAGRFKNEDLQVFQNSQFITIWWNNVLFKINKSTRMLLFQLSILIVSFMITSIWLPHGQLLVIYEEDSLTHQMLITVFLQFLREGHQEPCNEIKSLSSVKHLVRIDATWWKLISNVMVSNLMKTYYHLFVFSFWILLHGLICHCSDMHLFLFRVMFLNMYPTCIWSFFFMSVLFCRVVMSIFYQWVQMLR